MGQSANAAAIRKKIQIDSLPFNITAPGTYVLTGNLTCSLTRSGNEWLGAINISTVIPGPVVVDLKGFTITGPGSNSFALTIGAIASGANTYPITIRNGSIKDFEYGITASADSPYPLTDVTVNNIAFAITSTGNAIGYGINFNRVGSSTVGNCIISGASYGIADSQSSGDNRYNNVTFIDNWFPIIIANGAKIMLNHCQFDGEGPK